jgi:hypothetical protein
MSSIDWAIEKNTSKCEVSNLFLDIQSIFGGEAERDRE